MVICNKVKIDRQKAQKGDAILTEAPENGVQCGALLQPRLLQQQYCNRTAKRRGLLLWSNGAKKESSNLACRRCSARWRLSLSASRRLASAAVQTPWKSDNTVSVVLACKLAKDPRIFTSSFLVELLNCPGSSQSKLNTVHAVTTVIVRKTMQSMLSTVNKYMKNEMMNVKKEDAWQKKNFNR